MSGAGQAPRKFECHVILQREPEFYSHPTERPSCVAFIIFFHTLGFFSHACLLLSPQAQDGRLGLEPIWGGRWGTSQGATCPGAEALPSCRKVWGQQLMSGAPK